MKNKLKQATFIVYKEKEQELKGSPPIERMVGDDGSYTAIFECPIKAHDFILAKVDRLEWWKEFGIDEIHGFNNKREKK